MILVNATFKYYYSSLYYNCISNNFIVEKYLRNLEIEVFDRGDLYFKHNNISFHYEFNSNKLFYILPNLEAFQVQTVKNFINLINSNK